MSNSGSFFTWAKERSSPKDLAPLVIGGWLLKKGVDTSNEMFIFIALYLFGLVPAWWADKTPAAAPGPPERPTIEGPKSPPPPAQPDQATLGGSEES